MVAACDCTFSITSSIVSATSDSRARFAMEVGLGVDKKYEGAQFQREVEVKLDVSDVGTHSNTI